MWGWCRCLHMKNADNTILSWTISGRIMETSVRKGTRLPHSSRVWLTQCAAHISPQPSFTIDSASTRPWWGLQSSPRLCISSKGLGFVDTEQQKHPHHQKISFWAWKTMLPRRRRTEYTCQGKHGHMTHMTHAHKQDWHSSLQGLASLTVDYI